MASARLKLKISCPVGLHVYKPPTVTLVVASVNFARLSPVRLNYTDVGSKWRHLIIMVYGPLYNQISLLHNNIFSPNLHLLPIIARFTVIMITRSVSDLR